MTLEEIHVGDVVRIDGDTKPWRVDERTSDGMLTLESLHTIDRIVWRGVYEFRAQKSSVFS